MAAAEQKLFGFDHSHVGGLLAKKWGLPKALENAIRYHHDVASDEDHQDTTAIISVADTLASQAGFGNNAPAEVFDMDSVAESLVGLPEQQLAVVCEVMKQEVAKAQSAFPMPKAA